MSISNASVTTASIQRWKKTASGSETSLSGADDSGNILAYTPGYEQLYLNGVMLVRGTDYVATTGTSITGLTALVSSDVVEILGLSAFNVWDASGNIDQVILANQVFG